VKTRMMCAAALLLTVLAGAATVPAIAATTTPELLQRGGQWMALRAGYVKGTGKVAPNGLVGFGFGYRRFMLDNWSMGAFASYDLLGRFGDAAEIQVPLTLELVRHTRWGAAVYPYIGLGAGAYYTKLYRTGEDQSGFTPGRFVTLGVNTPVQKNGMLGLDIRLAQVERTDGNPAFPGPDGSRPKVDDLLVIQAKNSYVTYNNDESKMRSIWSMKIEYTFAF
jgi:hypothetical protein